LAHRLKPPPTPVTITSLRLFGGRRFVERLFEVLTFLAFVGAANPLDGRQLFFGEIEQARLRAGSEPCSRIGGAKRKRSFIYPA
jgi:hypothetical protein